MTSILEQLCRFYLKLPRTLREFSFPNATNESESCLGGGVGGTYSSQSFFTHVECQTVLSPEALHARETERGPRLAVKRVASFPSAARTEVHAHCAPNKEGHLGTW